MDAIVLFKNWLIEKCKSLLRNIMRMKPGGAAPGEYGSKRIIVIKKEVNLDESGNEIAGTVKYKAFDASGNLIKEFSNIIEAYRWLDEYKNTYTLS